jgi:DNA polymerase
VSAGKAAKLETIAQEIRQLEASPLYTYRQEHGYSPVVGEGNPDAGLMFIGDAPGKQEAVSGRPFVGRAGGVLDGLLESIGIDRQGVYITNVVKDRPPGNRDPHVEEVELYAPFLVRQIGIIQPEVIATLGRFAIDFVLDHYDLPQQGRKIGDLHGEVLEAEASYGKVAIVPLYHPAAAFYSQGLEETMQTDFQVLKRLCQECQERHEDQ